MHARVIRGAAPVEGQASDRDVPVPTTLPRWFALLDHHAVDLPVVRDYRLEIVDRLRSTGASL